jgi:hypothetical protein
MVCSFVTVSFFIFYFFLLYGHALILPSQVLDEWSSINYQSKKKEKKKKKKFAIYGNLCFNVYIDLIINGFPQYNGFSILSKGHRFNS